MERIIISNLKKKGIMSFDTYTMIVSNDKTIFAKVTSKILKEEVDKARKDAKQDGKGFFGQWGAQLGASFNFSNRYAAMAERDILAEEGKNFSIDNSTITKVELKTHHDQQTARTSYDVIVKTTGGKYSYQTKQDPSSGLKKAFGDKVN